MSNDEAKKQAHEILIPKTTKVMYGEVEHEILNLSIKSILRIAAIIGVRMGRIYEVYYEEISESEKIAKVLDCINEDEILEVISIALHKDLKYVKEKFRLADGLSVLRAVFQQEDVDKIFFEMKKIQKMFKK